MSEAILIYRKTFTGGERFVVLGDATEDDFLNWDGEHPCKLSSRIFSVLDNVKLDAFVTDLNSAVIADWDQENWFHCIFHSYFWYGYKLTGTLYEEETSTVLGLGSAGIAGPWYPFNFAFAAGDITYGNDDPTVDGTYGYFKIVDITYHGPAAADGGTSGKWEIEGTLALSTTDSGDPEQYLYFHDIMDLNNITGAAYKHSEYYYASSGGDPEETEDHKFAVEWASAAIDDEVTKYASTYVENKTQTVLDKGVLEEDADLSYITYGDPPLPGRQAYDAIVLDKAIGDSVSAYSSGNYITGLELTSTFEKIANNIYFATANRSGNVYHVLALYSGEYDAYSLWAGTEANKDNAVSNFTDSWQTTSGVYENTVTETNIKVNSVYYNSKYYLHVLPTVAVMEDLQNNGKGVYFGSRSTSTIRSSQPAANIRTSWPEKGDPPSDPETYIFNIIDDYYAFVSDWNGSSGGGEPSGGDAETYPVEDRFVLLSSGVRKAREDVSTGEFAITANDDGATSSAQIIPSDVELIEVTYSYVVPKGSKMHINFSIYGNSSWTIQSDSAYETTGPTENTLVQRTIILDKAAIDAKRSSLGTNPWRMRAWGYDNPIKNFNCTVTWFSPAGGDHYDGYEVVGNVYHRGVVGVEYNEDVLFTSSSNYTTYNIPAGCACVVTIKGNSTDIDRFRMRRNKPSTGAVADTLPDIYVPSGDFLVTATFPAIDEDSCIWALPYGDGEWAEIWTVVVETPESLSLDGTWDAYYAGTLARYAEGNMQNSIDYTGGSNFSNGLTDRNDETRDYTGSDGDPGTRVNVDVAWTVKFEAANADSHILVFKVVHAAHDHYWTGVAGSYKDFGDQLGTHTIASVTAGDYLPAGTTYPAIVTASGTKRMQSGWGTSEQRGNFGYIAVENISDGAESLPIACGVRVTARTPV